MSNAVGRWLFFIHQIPPKPDYFRVKVRRRLHQIGAIALKNSVYVLPRSEDGLEDFHWLRRMVVDEGGEATLCAAALIEGVNDAEVESMFRTQTNVEYAEIIGAARAALAKPTDAEHRRLVRQLKLVSARDFFEADQAEPAAQAIRDLEAALESRGAQSPVMSEGGSDRPSGVTWVTRSGVFVDRISSAWLIKRFIDRNARFKFVPAEGYVPQPGELRFDMFEGEYTHEGDDCTFEVLVKRFVPRDHALRVIAEVIHDIDCKDEKFQREETAGVASLIRGIAFAHNDDVARLEAGEKLFDSLYSSAQQQGE